MPSLPNPQSSIPNRGSLRPSRHAESFYPMAKPKNPNQTHFRRTKPSNSRLTAQKTPIRPRKPEQAFGSEKPFSNTKNPFQRPEMSRQSAPPARRRQPQTIVTKRAQQTHFRTQKSVVPHPLRLEEGGGPIRPPETSRGCPVLRAAKGGGRTYPRNCERLEPTHLRRTTIN